MIKKHPRHYTRLIMKDSKLKKWVEENTRVDTLNLGERIYSAVTQESPICENGRPKKFRSANLGYGFCGQNNVCLCNKAHTALSVSDSKLTDHNRDTLPFPELPDFPSTAEVIRQAQELNQFISQQ